jgi:Tfp pilus assembly protein PilV
MIKRYSQRGDTLVEVTIAIAIISAVIASTANLANYTFRVGATARQRTEAASILEQEAELIRNQRDTAIVGPGWASFRYDVFNTPFAPACPSVATTYTLSAAPIAGGNTWVSSKTGYTITTSQSVYTMSTTACSLGTGSDGGTDDIDFTINLKWTAEDGETETAALEIELVDTSDINQQAQAL